MVSQRHLAVVLDAVKSAIPRNKTRQPLGNGDAEVDAQVAKATAAGGKADPTPTQEYGDFMYGRSFEDPDGHIWEVMWMDPAAIPAGEPDEAAA